MSTAPARVEILLLDEWRAAPTSQFKWGAFAAEAGRGCSVCTHWFRNRSTAVTYARAQHWHRYGIARFF